MNLSLTLTLHLRIKKRKTPHENVWPFYCRYRVLQYTADVTVHNMISLRAESTRGSTTSDGDANNVVVNLQLHNLAQVSVHNIVTPPSLEPATSSTTVQRYNR